MSLDPVSKLSFVRDGEQDCMGLHTRTTGVLAHPCCTQRQPLLSLAREVRVLVAQRNKTKRGRGKSLGQRWPLTVFSTVESRYSSLTQEDCQSNHSSTLKVTKRSIFIFCWFVCCPIVCVDIKGRIAPTPPVPTSLPAQSFLLVS